MKKIKRIIQVISFLYLIILLSNTESLAINYKTLEVNEYTEAYERWESLSDEEKSKTIQPTSYSITKKTSNDIELMSETLPSYYKLNNMIVRNQGITNSCWAFSTTAIISSNIQKMNNVATFNLLSVRHMDYATNKIFSDGINVNGYNRITSNGDGGNYSLGFGYCTSGKGPISENQMPFINSYADIPLESISGKTVTTKINQIREYTPIYKNYSSNSIRYYNGYGSASEKFKEYSTTEVTQIRNEIKQHIMDYGAISGYTYINGGKFLNTDSNGNLAYYSNDKTLSPNHAITIVGWDDSYSKDNFDENNKPQNDGAYIIMNSWGSSWGNQGYYYISYDDFFIEMAPSGVVNTENKNYDNIYQHDPLGMNQAVNMYESNNSIVKELYIANVFSRDTNKQEELTEVSLYLADKSDVQIYINSENDNKTTLTKVTNWKGLEAGYNTIKLTTPKELTGSNFVVAARIYDSDGVEIPLEYNVSANKSGYTSYYDTATANEGESFIGDGNEWQDITESFAETNVCLKAFTKSNETVAVSGITLNKNNLEIEKGETETLIATINPSNASNKNVSWSSSDNNIISVSNEGIITANAEGTATITVKTEEGGYEAECNINVVKKQLKVTYMAHIQDIGWDTWKNQGEVAGAEGQNKKIEALKIKLSNTIEGVHIKYQTHVQDIGWLDYVQDGEISGTEGQNKKIEAIRICLEGDENYAVEYRAYIQGKGWQDWVSDGITAGTTGQNLKLELIQIRIVEKENKQEVVSGITAQGHVQDYGWQTWVTNDESYEKIKIGVEGAGKKIEAIKLQLTNCLENAHIKYQTHVQDIGWTDYVKDGEISGTTGRNLKIEAIRIYLENMPEYTVEYRAYIQGKGWQDWVSDGITTGTTGKNLKLEAIEIRIIKTEDKQEVKPGLTYQGHIQDIGWDSWKNENDVIGFIGQNKKIEAIKVQLTNISENVHIKYRTHVQDIGWTDYVKDGEISGTTGRNLKVEAIQIEAENLEGYKIQYRSYVSGKWQEWVDEKVISGTTGKNLKIEAIQLRIVENSN